jgi:hypothetical protein
VQHMQRARAESQMADSAAGPSRVFSQHVPLRDPHPPSRGVTVKECAADIKLKHAPDAEEEDGRPCYNLRKALRMFGHRIYLAAGQSVSLELLFVRLSRILQSYRRPIGWQAVFQATENDGRKVVLQTDECSEGPAHATAHVQHPLQPRPRARLLHRPPLPAERAGKL